MKFYKIVMASFFIMSLANAMEVSVFQTFSNGDVSYLVTNPIYPGSSYSFVSNVAKDETGVCVRLGFEKFVNGSSTYKSSSSAAVLLVTKDGFPVEMQTTKPLLSVVCLNKVADAPNFPLLITIPDPRHAESNLPVVSKEDKDELAVCKYLGTDGYLKNSVNYSSNKTLSLLIDDTGAVVGAQLTTPILSLVCIQN